MQSEEPNPVPLDYGTPHRRPPMWWRAAPYAVFALCAGLAGLFASWIRPGTMGYALFVPLAVFFGLGAVVLPFLIRRENER